MNLKDIIRAAIFSLIFIASIAAVWLVAGGPIPYIVLLPPTASIDAPTFEKINSDFENGDVDGLPTFEPVEPYSEDQVDQDTMEDYDSNGENEIDDPI